MSVEISGRYEVKSSPGRTWELLNDVAVLQSCIPGCKSLTETGKDQYEAEIAVGIGPVRGTYKGTVQIKDRKPPKSYRLIVEGKGGAGSVLGDGAITLSENASGGTTIEMAGKADATGTLARVGQRLITGASNQLAKKFFDNLAKHAK